VRTLALARSAAAVAVQRYQRERPGSCCIWISKSSGESMYRTSHHGDRRPGKLNRGIGWDFVHVAIDDASRVALASIVPDELAHTASAFLKASVARSSSTVCASRNHD